MLLDLSLFFILFSQDSLDINSELSLRIVPAGTGAAAGLALIVADGSLWTGLRHTGPSRTKITCGMSQRS